MNIKIISGVLIVVFLIVLGVWHWEKTQPQQLPQTNSITVETKSNSLGSQIYDQTSNPVGNSLPQTNPIQQTSTNPFSGYTNPFDNK